MRKEVQHLVHLTLAHVLFLAAAGFVAAFVDAIAGGGGIISVPALLAVGMGPSVVLGTNKLASTMSSTTSTLSYLVHGKMNRRLITKLVPLSFAGALCGAFVVRQIPSSFLRPLVVVLLCGVTAYTLLRPKWGKVATMSHISRRKLAFGIVAALVIGFYDGFFGPGTGSFLIIVFLFFGFDYVVASGNAKALNFGSNLGALVMFLSLHSVQLTAGLTMGAAMILGALTGSRVAIHSGARFVRPVFITVTLAMVLQQVWKLLHG